MSKMENILAWIIKPNINSHSWIRVITLFPVRVKCVTETATLSEILLHYSVKSLVKFVLREKKKQWKVSSKLAWLDDREWQLTVKLIRKKTV